MQRSLLFSVPLSQSQLVLGELYYQMVLDRDIQSGPDHVAIKDFSPNAEGFSSQKIYSLRSWLPQFIGELVQDKHLPISVRQYFNCQYGTYTSNVHCHNFSQLRITLDKGMISTIDENSPHKLDIVSVGCQQFKGIESKVLSILGKKFSIDFKSRKDWRSQAKQLSHVRIDLTITSNYSEADELLLREVENACLEYVYSYYKGLLLMFDKWADKTNLLDIIHKIQLIQVFANSQILDSMLDLYNSFRTAGNSLAKRSPKAELLFGGVVNTYSDLIEKTWFSKLVERRSAPMYISELQVSAPVQNLGRSSLGGNHQSSLSQLPSSSKLIKGSPFKRGLIFIKIIGYFSDSWEERLALLDGRVLYYATDSSEESKLKETFPLEGATVEESSDPARSLVFRLVGREGKPSLLKLITIQSAGSDYSCRA